MAIGGVNGVAATACPMAARSNVSPVPLQLEARDPGIAVRYLDGRLVEYATPIADADHEVGANITYAIHVLVTDESETEGVMVYLNDYDTSDDVLESTGVGRILLEEGESASVYPGVTASRSGDRIDVGADAAAVAGSVLVFVENQLEERAYRLA